MSADQISALNTRIILMQDLKRHEGWQLYMEVTGPLHENALAQAMKATDPWTGAKNLGAAGAYAGLSSWADREIMVAQKQIEQIKKEMELGQQY